MKIAFFSSVFQGTDKSYLIKQHQELEDQPYYIKGNDRRTWEKEFGILHYAGAVTYVAAGFLDKNKDVQQDQLFELMYNSTNAFVQDLTRFQVKFDLEGNGKRECAKKMRCIC